jgi:phage recombination protein Bet
MNNVVSLSTNPANYTTAQIKLIKDTVAKDTNPMEFDLFITVAQRAGLDPFRKQIYALVFNKDKADKRNMSIITGIDGFRVIAARSGRYRPDEDEATYEYDPALRGPLNPLGIVKATVRIHIADAQKAGGWKPVTGWAYWDEFAPIKDEWAENEQGKWKPTGKQTLDTTGNWARMPRVMIAKCAEAQALRKAFPEDLSGLYETAELDRAQAAEMSPSEMIGQLNTDARLAKIGAINGITFQLFPNGPLESIAIGQIADRVMNTVSGFGAIEQIRWFESANTHPLREFWARAPTDGLALKKHIEAKRAELEKAAVEPQGAA